MAIFDLVSNGANWIIGTNANGTKTGLPSYIESVQKFSDSLTYQRCTQFVDEGLDFVGIGDCNPSIQDTLSRFTKNTFSNRYISKFTSAVDMLKNKAGSLANVKEKFGQSYYCTILAPMFNILINLIESLVYLVKKILALIYMYIAKILEIIKNLVNKLFSCFEAAIEKFKSLLDNIKAPDFLNFMKGVTVWSERCEIIAGPIVSMFNLMVANSTIKQMLYDLGSINSTDTVIHFDSIQEVNAFLKVALNLADSINNKKTKVLNEIYNSSPIQNAAYGYKLMKAYTQYAIASVTEKILAPIIRLNSIYNNLLHTRSRYLGIVVNTLIGWLFPPKGYAHNYEDNIIRRRKYSIVDVLIICDSLNDCNDYLCGGLKNRIEELFNELKLNRTCWWMNPLIDANSYLTKIASAIETAYSNAFTPVLTNKAEMEKYVDISFIKNVRSFNGAFFTVEGY